MFICSFNVMSLQFFTFPLKILLIYKFLKILHYIIKFYFVCKILAVYINCRAWCKILVVYINCRAWCKILVVYIKCRAWCKILAVYINCRAWCKIRELTTLIIHQQTLTKISSWLIIHLSEEELSIFWYKTKDYWTFSSSQ